MQTTLPQIELSTKKPEIKIESPRPKIYIDQRECFADCNRRGISQFSQYCADLAFSDAAAGIDRIVSDGNFLADIAGGGTVEELAAQAMGGQCDFNMTTIPKHRPKIDFDIRPVKIDFNPGTIDSNFHRGHVENNFERGKVELYLAQKNFLEINWVKSKFDKVI